ncbi:BtaA family protein [Streptomyces sp. PTM05]|uniref:BtaA family protein n=1 Tax=Streptantibioticus parmotrematis TaxID=2873249 RepID=A0ABS7QU67_9ACTN|nr:BtaA family protein [Streptantibioticus parmotrematis]MBY8886753.1 BtaA family protein [Streptantibioticus parmotrematis]
MSAGTPWSHGRILAGRSGSPRLLFGRMYEDPGIELAVFPAAPARVLCVASAGDTAAALAHAGYEVTAVDVNPRQLDYARARVVDGAPARTGTAERLTAVGRHVTAGLLPAWQPTALRAFLRLDDPARQLRWWHERIDGAGLRLLTASALRPAGPLTALLRPGFRGVAPPRFDAVLRARTARVVASCPNTANPLLRLLLLGEAPDPVPVSGIRFVRADVAEHLESVPAGSYDAVTLSNVLDGPGRAYARRLRAAVERAVRPGGVAVLRSVREDRVEQGDPTSWRSDQDGRHLRGASPSPQERCPLWGTVRVLHTGGNP